nr:hypothetical protein [Tanacetum cinerariifolium]
MPWRNIDTDVRDDFPTIYNEGDAKRLAKHVVPLHPPCHLLYVCGLTMACRHLKLSHSIKDSTSQRNKYVLSMYDFLQLPVWTAMVVSKGDLIPDNQRPVNRTTPHLAVGQLIPEKTATQRNIEKPNPKMAKAREKKEKVALAKIYLKRARGEGFRAPQKKRDYKDKDTIVTIFEETTSIMPIHQANLKLVDDTTTSQPKGIARDAVGGSRSPNFEKEENVVVSDAHSIHSDHDEGNDEDIVVHCFVSCFFRACKELVTHLATPDEEEFLSGLLNVELNKEYVDLCNRSDTQLEELNHLRNDLQRIMQASDGLSKKLVLLENDHSYYTHRERELMDRLKGMEIKRDEWRQIASEQVEKIKKLEDPLEPKSK